MSHRELDCDELVELVTAFLEGALNPAEQARFVAHLALCDGCATYLEQYRTTIGLLGELPQESLTPHARDTLLDAFRTWKD